MTDHPVRIGQSLAMDAVTAVAELHAQLASGDLALVCFFCSASYDLDALAAEVARRFGTVPVIGCTTAGTIGPLGYGESGVAGMAFSAGSFAVECGRIERLQEFTEAAGRQFALDLKRSLRERLGDEAARYGFALSLIDGLSMREEHFALALQDGLGTIPLIGASAGDDLRFNRTRVYSDGRFHDDAAVLAVLATRLPFRVLRTQHFVSDGERLVVTEADPANRIVQEINGLPAVEEYARLIGVRPDQLTPVRFAAHPLVMRINGQDYVRAIRSANIDGSLTLYCAIDEGVVLRVARGEDILGKLEEALEETGGAVGVPAGMLLCDCVLRQLEIARAGRQESMTALLKRFNAVGLSTYGEQSDGMHVNQTLTGIIIGSGEMGHG